MVAVATGGTASAATSSCALEAITPNTATANGTDNFGFTVRNPSGQTDNIKLVRIHSQDGGNGLFSYIGNNIATADWTTYDTGDGLDIVAAAGNPGIAPGDAYDFFVGWQAPTANGAYYFLVTAGDNPSGGDIECSGSLGYGIEQALAITVTGGTGGGGTTPDGTDITQRDIKIISFVLATGVSMWFLSFFRFRRAR